MAYNVNQQSVNVNSMIHIDLNKAELDSLKSTKLPGLIQSWRIQEIAVYRTIHHNITLISQLTDKRISRNKCLQMVVRQS